MANVLVTGGTGLLGGPTVRKLLSLGHNVVAYDLTPNLDNLGDAQDHVEVVRGDIANLPSLMRVVKGKKIERVIHLAGFIKHQSIADPLGAVMANAAATSYLCELGVAFDLERIVWASTAGVYGRRDQYPDGARVTETDLVGPSSPYGATKVACEQIAQNYRDNQGLDVVGFRLAYVYGLGRLTGATGRFNDMLRRLALGESATFPALAGGPSSSWQPVFNEDMAEVFCEATFAPTTEHTIFNAPVDETLTVDESMATLRELVPGAQVELSPDAVGMGTVPLMDGTRAQETYNVPLKHRLKGRMDEDARALCDRGRAGAAGFRHEQRVPVTAGPMVNGCLGSNSERVFRRRRVPESRPDTSTPVMAWAPCSGPSKTCRLRQHRVMKKTVVGGWAC